jgi:hypothetical protein
MNKHYKALITGIGSILSIGPSTSYAEFLPNDDPKERMRSHWEDTGKHMQKALGQYRDEQKQK